jgi:hypothetical protein
MPSSPRIGQLSSLLALLLLFLGCNALNPLCGSARPVPILASISPKTTVFAQLPPSFALVLTGSQFVSSSVVVFNGATLVTAVNSSSQLTVTITSAMVPATGSYSVQVQNPAGNSGNLGCDSGGKSATLTLTVT